MLYGNGVTRNFLSILENERDRNRKRLVRLGLLAGVLALLAWLFFYNTALEGLGSFAAFLAGGLVLGGLYAQFVNVRRYNASIHKHWNKWMRYSVSCVSVNECYKKVHNRHPGLGIGWWASILAVVIVAHLVLAAMAINADAGFVETLYFFALDAVLVGFFIGKRLLERRWFNQFLTGVNDLLREGEIGVWGVY
jgi:branched-subunit amino acid transport protein AzlD